MRLIVTGAAGFIGNFLANYFKTKSYKIIGVDHIDHFSRPHVNQEIFEEMISCDSLEVFKRKVDGIIHVGAITNTSESSWEKLFIWNVEYSMKIWKTAIEQNIPLIYASSASTYGNGRKGFSDSHETLFHLEPLNLYGKSKHDFDCWALQQEKQPKSWWGLKFFNVFGPFENHKGSMASVVYHGFQEINKTGSHTLFRSHRDDIPDGHQKRDFVYVKDIAAMMEFLLEKNPSNGIVNAGSGTARTFLDLSHATFRALQKEPRIIWKDTPEQYRAHYQYFTEAEMTKIRVLGYTKNFTQLEDAVEDYVRNYLLPS